mgnify:FL=1
MKKKIIKRLLIYLFVVLASIWAAFPFYWALTTSFKSKADVFKPLFIPFIQFQPTLENWLSEAMLRGEVIMLGLRNSLIAACTSAVLCVILGGMAGYALARFKFRRWKNRDIIIWFFSLRFLPPIAVAIPFFLIFMNMGLIDNVLSLILSYTVFFMPFSTLVLRDIFKGIPRELEESALVDGCNWFSAFRRIALPLAAPGLIAAFIICFALAWNEFLFALILTYRNATTIPVVIAGAEHSQGVDFWYICTRSVIAITPPVILATLVQKWLVSGLTLGAVRGAR